jgi:hypothetical protein
LTQQSSAICAFPPSCPPRERRAAAVDDGAGRLALGERDERAAERDGRGEGGGGQAEAELVERIRKQLPPAHAAHRQPRPQLVVAGRVGGRGRLERGRHERRAAGRADALGGEGRVGLAESERADGRDRLHRNPLLRRQRVQRHQRARVRADELVDRCRAKRLEPAR